MKSEAKPARPRSFGLHQTLAQCRGGSHAKSEKVLRLEARKILAKQLKNGFLEDSTVPVISRHL